MAITSTSTKGVTSKVCQVKRYEITAWVQNDELVIDHAKDPKGARQIKVITTSTKVEDPLATVYAIRHISDTQTGVKALAASPVAVAVVCVVPTT